MTRKVPIKKSRLRAVLGTVLGMALAVGLVIVLAALASCAWAQSLDTSPAQSPAALSQPDPCAFDPAFVLWRASCEKQVDRDDTGDIDDISESDDSSEACAMLPVVDSLFADDSDAAAEVLERVFDMPASFRQSFLVNASFFLPYLLTSPTCPVSGTPGLSSALFGNLAESSWGKPAGFLLVGRLTKVRPEALEKMALKIDDEATRRSVERATRAFAELFSRSVGLERVRRSLAKTPQVGRSPALFPTTQVWEESLRQLAPYLEALDRALEASIDDPGLGRRFERLAAVIRQMPGDREQALAFTRAGVGLLVLGRPIEAWTCLVWAEEHYRQLDLSADPVAELTRFLGTMHRLQAAMSLELLPEAMRLMGSLQVGASPLEQRLAGGLFQQMLVAPRYALDTAIQQFEEDPLAPEEADLFWLAFQIAVPGLAGSPDAVRAAVAALDTSADQDAGRQPILLTAVTEAWLIDGIPRALEEWRTFAYRSPHWMHGIWPAAMMAASGEADPATLKLALGALIDFMEVGLDPLWSDELVRSSIEANTFRHYTAAVDITEGLGSPGEAFSYAERGRSFTLRRLLGVPRDRSVRAPDAGNLGISALAAARQRSIGTQLVALELAGGAAEGAAGDQNELRARFASARLEDKLLEARKELPDFPAPIDLETLQSEILEPDQTLLAYFPGLEALHVFVVRPDAFVSVTAAWPLTELDQVAGKVWETRWAGTLPQECEHARTRNAALLVDCPEGERPEDAEHWLYERLIAPVREHLPPGKLIVVPYGALHRVPWGALRAPDGHRLIEDFEIAVVPSADTLATLRRRSDSAAPSPSLDTPSLDTPSLDTPFLDAPFLDALVLGDPTTYLPELPSALREAQTVASFLGVKGRLREAATETALRELAPRARLLHIAAHGVYQAGHPLFSRVQLAADQANDGFLFVHEIWDSLDLKQSRLVVLSACDTAAGKPTRGDDIVGLTQAFLVAGSPAVVSTLWPVDDRASSALMTSFYGHFRDGASAGESLRQAQLELLASRKHSAPYFWAGYTLVGDARARWKYARPAQTPRKLPAGMVASAAKPVSNGVPDLVFGVTAP